MKATTSEIASAVAGLSQAIAAKGYYGVPPRTTLFGKANAALRGVHPGLSRELVGKVATMTLQELWDILPVQEGETVELKE